VDSTYERFVNIDIHRHAQSAKPHLPLAAAATTNENNQSNRILWIPSTCTALIRFEMVSLLGGGLFGGNPLGGKTTDYPSALHNENKLMH